MFNGKESKIWKSLLPIDPRSTFYSLTPSVNSPFCPKSFYPLTILSFGSLTFDRLPYRITLFTGYVVWDVSFSSLILWSLSHLTVTEPEAREELNRVYCGFRKEYREQLPESGRYQCFICERSGVCLTSVVVTTGVWFSYPTTTLTHFSFVVTTLTLTVRSSLFS